MLTAKPTTWQSTGTKWKLVEDNDVPSGLADAIELCENLARRGLADTCGRELIDSERPEVCQRHLTAHEQRSQLLGIADALEPAHPSL